MAERIEFIEETRSETDSEDPLLTTSSSHLSRVEKVAGVVAKASKWLRSKSYKRGSLADRTQRYRLEEEAAAQRDVSYLDVGSAAAAAHLNLQLQDDPQAHPLRGLENLPRRQRLCLLLFGSAEGHTLHPHAPFSLFWRALVILATVFAAFAAPFEAAFSGPGGASVFGRLWDINVGTARGLGQLVNFFRLSQILVEIIFAVDVFVKLRTGYESDAQAATVMDPKLIRRHYRQTDMTQDVLAALPLVLAEIPGIHHLFGNFTRLLQLAKLPAALRTMLRLSDPVADKTGSLVTILVLLLIAFLLVAHFLGCMWFLVQSRQPCVYASAGGVDLSCSWLGTLTDLDEHVAGWVNRESTRESFLLHSLHLYAACYYWSSSAGDGFAANSTAERLCAVLGQITVVNGLGAFIVALLLSAVQEFSTTWQRHSMYRKKIDAVNAYLERHNFPACLVALIRRYYRHVWTRQMVDFSDAQLLDELPTTLRHEALLHLTRALLERSDFFSDWLRVHQSTDSGTSGGGALAPYPAGMSRSRASPSGSPSQLVTLESLEDVSVHVANNSNSAAGPEGAESENHPFLSASAGAHNGQHVDGRDGHHGPGGSPMSPGIPTGSPSRRAFGGPVPFPTVTEAERDQWSSAIASRLHPRSAAPGDLIIKQGDVGDEMFIIKSGKVQIEIDGVPTGTSTSGSYVGEFALLDNLSPNGAPGEQVQGAAGSAAAGNVPLQHRRLASVRAVGYVELFVLNRADMRELFAEFPNLRRVMEAVAREKLVLGARLTMMNAQAQAQAQGHGHSHGSPEPSAASVTVTAVPPFTAAVSPAELPGHGHGGHSGYGHAAAVGPGGRGASPLGGLSREPSGRGSPSPGAATVGHLAGTGRHRIQELVEELGKLGASS